MPIFYSISDLHLGDKGPKDDFYGNEQKLAEFLQSIPDNSLILVGDVFELWQCHLDNIIAAYPDLIKLLFKRALYYITGNHDQAILKLNVLPTFQIKMLLGVPVVEKLILGDILFMHGHQFDAANSKYKWLGQSITGLAGWLEKYIHKDIDVWAEQFVMKLKKLGRFGYPDQYRKDAIAYAKKEGVKRIVIGHSHVEDYAKTDDIEFYNCGCWVNGKSHVIKI